MDFLQLIQDNGAQGAYIGFIVLVAVFASAKAGLTPTKGQKQMANVVLSFLLAGVNLLDPAKEDAVVFMLGSVGSALLYEFLRYLAAKAPKA